MIIKLFQAKIKLGGGTRAAKAQAIDNLYKSHDIKTKYELDKLQKHTEKLKALQKEIIKKDREILANELHKPFRRPSQLRKINFRSKDNIWRC